MLTTQPNKEKHCECSQHNQIKNFIFSAFLYLVMLWAFAACVLSNWRSCFLNLQAFLSICKAFLYLVVLWAFAVRALSNWRSCFLNLQVFFSICSMLSSLGHRMIVSFDWITCKSVLIWLAGSYSSLKRMIRAWTGHHSRLFACGSGLQVTMV